MQSQTQGEIVTGAARATTEAAETRIREGIIKLARYFEDSFALGVKYKVISQKYYKSAERAGLDLRAILDDLEAENLIYTYMNETGAVLIMVPEMSKLIQQDEFGLISEEAKQILREKWGKR